MASGTPTHPALDLPTSGSELKRTAEAMRRYHNSMYDIFLGWAHDMERALRNAEGGNPWLLGMDKRLAARRVVRPIIKAAEEHRNIAKGWIRMERLFTELFQGAPAGRHSSGHKIDVNG
jgi:hypothetical protein